MVLDTGTVPPGSPTRSDKNQLWNRNTLVLMQRAGLLDILETPPPALERDPGRTEDAWQERLDAAWDEYVRLTTVRIRPDVDNLDEAAVHGRLRSGSASEIRDSEAASMDRVERMFGLNECWGGILSEEYSYQDVGPMHANQVVAAACSGCPATEHVPEPSYRAALPVVAEAVAAGPAPRDQSGCSRRWPTGAGRSW